MKTYRAEQVTKTFLEVAPAWAHGCEHCKYGMVNPPPLIGMAPVYEERALQFADGELVLCDCRAGHMMRQYLRRVSSAISDSYRDMMRVKANEFVKVPSMRYEEAETA